MRSFFCVSSEEGAAINADVIGCSLLTGRVGNPKKLSFFGPLSPLAIPPEPFILSEWVCGEWGPSPLFLAKSLPSSSSFLDVATIRVGCSQRSFPPNGKYCGERREIPPPFLPMSDSFLAPFYLPILSRWGPSERNRLVRNPPPPLRPLCRSLSCHWATDPVTSPFLHASAVESASERRRRTAAARAWGGRCVPRRTVETQQQQSEAPLHGRGMAFTRSVSLKPF